MSRAVFESATLHFHIDSSWDFQTEDTNESRRPPLRLFDSDASSRARWRTTTFSDPRISITGTIMKVHVELASRLELTTVWASMRKRGCVATCLLSFKPVYSCHETSYSKRVEPLLLIHPPILLPSLSAQPSLRKSHLSPSLLFTSTSP